MDSLVRVNRLSAVLPGVYTATDSARDPAIRMRAAMLQHPDAVLMQSAAARVSFWPEVDVDVAPRTSADSIDLALRRRAVTLAGLYEALRLTPNRTGNVDRRRNLVDSRNEPWSAAERRAHRLLRRHRVTGWKANWPMWVAGNLYYVDIAFRGLRLAIEIDGRLHEDDADLFESDRWRPNALVLEGWDVLRFTWAMLRDHPEAGLSTVRAALKREVTARWISPAQQPGSGQLAVQNHRANSSAGAMSTLTFIVDVLASVKMIPRTGGTSP